MMTGVIEQTKDKTENTSFVTEKNLTEVVLQRWGDVPDQRLKAVMQSLIKHLHAFVRENEPTNAEWFAAVDFITRTGKTCDDKRQEVILLSDILGISMLVDAINNRLDSAATPTTVEGPFHIPNAPEIADGGNMAANAPGVPTFVVGHVRDLTGQPIANAALDLWQTDGDGLYESQRGSEEPWMRGLYHSKADGSFVVRTVAPIPYTIPMDGPVGALVSKTNISHMRPAHIHFAVGAPGYRGVVTHLFMRNDPYLNSDAVYGVKEPLIVDFLERPPGKAPNGELMKEPWYEVRYDFVLENDLM
jgi:hydroxyquinol 1,2-dioxygenase